MDCPLLKLMTVTPNFPFALLGRHAFLPIASSIRHIVSTKVYESIVSTAMAFLFQWRHDNINSDSKRSLFQHVFGKTSMKMFVVREGVGRQKT